MRRQEVVARLGLSAIVANDLQEVLDRITAAAVDTLDVGLAKVLELEPDGETFLLRAGAGWREGLIGRTRIPVDASQGGYSYALRATTPVVVEDFRQEERLTPPQLLIDHGVVSGMTVLIQTQSGPWGVLGVHSRTERRFSHDDIHFLQALANVVAAVLERQRVEEELQRSRSELASRVSDERLRRSERLASLGTLATGIAHEINNPVNTILMTADSALASVEAGTANGRLSEDLAVIAREAERCGEIVRKVLEFVRVQRPEHEKQDVNEIARSAVTMAAKTLGEAGPEIALELAEEMPPVRLSRVEIEQALIHLIRNAVQAGRETERTAVTVRTRVDGARHQVVLEVEDDGDGVPPEERDRIFDPFFTTRRDRGGTGLGLSLAHSIVTDHGGHIELDSEPGRGSSFRIELPLDAP